MGDSKWGCSLLGYLFAIGLYIIITKYIYVHWVGINWFFAFFAWAWPVILLAVIGFVVFYFKFMFSSLSGFILATTFGGIVLWFILNSSFHEELYIPDYMK